MALCSDEMEHIRALGLIGRASIESKWSCWSNLFVCFVAIYRAPWAA